jgi:hypothetical protein
MKHEADSGEFKLVRSAVGISGDGGFGYAACNVDDLRCIGANRACGYHKKD